MSTLRTLQRTSILLLLLTSLLLSGAAFAQGEYDKDPTFNLQRWRPAPNPADFLTVYSPNIDNNLRLTGGVYFNFADNPLVLQTSIGADKKGVVDYQLFADVYTSLALFEWVELGLVLPVGLAQASETAGAPFNQNFDTAGLGDLRVTAKGRILSQKDFPVGLALVANLATPTGDGTLLYGDDGFGFDVQTALEYVPYGAIRIAANLGYRYRPGKLQVERFTLGDALMLAGAVTVPFFSEDLDLLAEIHGEITVDGDNQELVSEERPVEAEFGFRYRVYSGDSFLDDLAITGALGFGSTGPGSPSTRAIIGVGYQWVSGGSWSERWGYGGYLSALEECPDPEMTPRDQIPEICRKNEVVDSDGDGVPDAQDSCPFKGEKGKVDARGCSTEDMDGDGILDVNDKCPAVPEDKDNYEDSDGCPDLDNDGDGIADLADKCPLQAEVINGIDDKDGCPDDDPNASVSVVGGKVKIKEQVFFETAKDKIKTESFPILNDVAKLLIDNPHIGSIVIEGHTDDRGKDDYNKELSQKRAEAVRTYLIDRGVEDTRLTAIGYGEERPIESNDTKEGQAKNRRVEFTIKGLDKK